MDRTANPWTTLRSTRVYDNPWIGVTEHQVINPRGNPGIYGTVHFKNLAIGVVPLDQDGATYLVGQFRYPHGSYSWEIPEGGGPLDQDPLASAARELAEETGLAARRWQEILRADLSNSATDERAIAYLACELEQGEAHPEEVEELQVWRLPFAEAYAMVERGEITDALSVLAIQKVQLMALQGSLADGLNEAVLRR